MSATVDKQVTCVLCCRRLTNTDGLSCGQTATMASSNSYNEPNVVNRVCLCQACQVSPKSPASDEVAQLLPCVSGNLTLSQTLPEELLTKSRQLSLSDECDEGDEDTNDSNVKTVTDQRENETTSESEVAELAGYLEDQLYLPRESVSADAALMADLMYT